MRGIGVGAAFDVKMECAHSAEVDGLLGDGKDGEDWGYVVKQPEGSGLFKVQKGLKWISSSASLL